VVNPGENYTDSPGWNGGVGGVTVDQRGGFAGTCVREKTRSKARLRSEWWIPGKAIQKRKLSLRVEKYIDEKKREKKNLNSGEGKWSAGCLG